MTSEWSPETVYQFLELYERHSILWDPKVRGHRMADARKKAWRSISQELGIDIDTIRKKYESLMASFRKLKKTAEEHAAPGATYGEVYAAEATNITWYAWDKMRFMLGPFDPDDVFVKKPGMVQKPRPPIRQVPQKSRVPIREVPPSSPEQEYEEEYLEYHDDDEGNNMDNDDHMGNDDDSDDEEFLIKVEPKMEKTPRIITRQLKPTVRPVRPLKRSAIRLRRSEPLKNVPKQNGTNKVLLARQHSQSEGMNHNKDECDSFGEYVACSLRKHNQRTQSMIKQAINNILFEQEMKKYGNRQYTVIGTEVDDDNPLSMEQDT